MTFKKGYKQTQEHKDKINTKERSLKISKNNARYWLGIEKTNEHIEKMVRTRKKNNSFKKNSGSFKKNDKRILKEKNYNWKGGITKLNIIIRSMPEYNNWRIKVFEKDNFTCKCGKRGCYIEAHHLKQFKTILMINQIKSIEDARICNELWNVDNGRTLCSPCHNKTKMGCND